MESFHNLHEIFILGRNWDNASKVWEIFTKNAVKIWRKCIGSFFGESRDVLFLAHCVTLKKFNVLCFSISYVQRYCKYFYRLELWFDKNVLLWKADSGMLTWYTQGQLSCFSEYQKRSRIIESLKLKRDSLLEKSKQLTDFVDEVFTSIQYALEII